MKIDEAPEKIILGADKDSKIINDYWVINDYTDNIKIQYVRMDAFIEKVCEWLQNHNNYLRIHDNGKGVRFDMTQCVIDFRKAMKE